MVSVTDPFLEVAVAIGFVEQSETRYKVTVTLSIGTLAVIVGELILDVDPAAIPVAAQFVAEVLALTRDTVSAAFGLDEQAVIVIAAKHTVMIDKIPLAIVLKTFPQGKSDVALM